MPPPTLLDLAQLRETTIVADRQAIEQVNRQRFEFQLLDAIIYFDEASGAFAGYHDIRSDAWWARGHVPQRPLFPGVLMIEVAAQLSSYAYHRLSHSGQFLAFAGVDEVKYRGMVEPPCRLLILGKSLQCRPRRFVAQTQGFVGDTMVFEGKITGMPVELAASG